MAFALKHDLKDAALQDLLKLIECICPSPNLCVKSLYNFKKCFNCAELSSKRIYYCTSCKSTITSNFKRCCLIKSCDAGESSSYFISIDILEQIKSLFKKPNFYDKLQHRFDRKVHQDCIADVYDGLIYKSLMKAGEFLSFKSNISLQWSTDGAALFNSSSFSIWPLLFFLELVIYLLKLLHLT